jgi:hypothetical protein
MNRGEAIPEDWKKEENILTPNIFKSWKRIFNKFRHPFINY